MGIKGFNSWLHTKYASCYSDKFLDNYTNMYIDLNYILHIVACNADGEKELLNKLDGFICRFIKKFGPENTYLFSDGSAPLAKMILQRKRRLGMIDIDSFNTLNFTPSTIFMETMKEYLEGCENKYRIFMRTTLDVNIGGCDESEIKISKKIRDNISKEQESTHIVISNDADVVLIMAGIYGGKNIYMSEANTQKVMSVGKIVQCHCNHFGGIYQDFVFLNLLMGNDYIPKIAYLTIDKIWKSYRSLYYSTGQSIINPDTNSINKRALTDFLVGCMVDTSKHFIDSDTNLEKMNFEAMQTYWQGLIWCYMMYIDGKCPDYRYMYIHNTNPGPFSLSIYINTIQSLYVEFKPREPLTPNLYGLLILPEKSKSILNFNTYSFEFKSDRIYENERCVMCTKYNKEIKRLNFLLKNHPKDTVIKRELKEFREKCRNHKDVHKELTLNEIKNIEYHFSKVYAN